MINITKRTYMTNKKNDRQNVVKNTQSLIEAAKFSKQLLSHSGKEAVDAAHSILVFVDAEMAKILDDFGVSYRPKNADENDYSVELCTLLNDGKESFCDAIICIKTGDIQEAIERTDDGITEISDSIHHSKNWLSVVNSNQRTID